MQRCLGGLAMLDHQSIDCIKLLRNVAAPCQVVVGDENLNCMDSKLSWVANPIDLYIQ